MLGESAGPERTSGGMERVPLGVEALSIGSCCRFEQRGGMLRGILSLEVPGVAGREVGDLFAAMSAESGIGRGDVAGWVLHAGEERAGGGAVGVGDRGGADAAERGGAGGLQECSNT